MTSAADAVAEHSQLQAPDVRFSAAQMTAAREVLAEQARHSRIGLALLGGSLAAGLGHSLSDIDLYVVYLDPPPSTVLDDRDGPPVHIEAMERKDLAELGAVAASFRATSSDRSQLFLAESQLKRLVRLATGLHVAGTDPELIAMIPDRQVVRQIIMARNACDFAVAAEDAFGAADTGDWYTALSASHSALQHAAEAALAAADDVYHGPKFLFRRLARTSATRHLVPELWFLTQAPVAVAIPNGWARSLVERRLLAGSHLLAWSLLDGWENRVDRFPPPPEQHTSGPRRHPAYSPLRFADGIALAGPHRGAEVSEGMLRAWRHLNGGDLAESLRDLVLHEPGFGTVTQSALTAAVEGLHGYGAVMVDQASSKRR
ncbi:hypothetical protein [Micromonospora andamanensis]|uniref:hypothetical protein n=1 Tax=Micromonospora andamanensis TaxID=1287068 RepID=UPI00194F19F6|nr:hypothetical protein [Micromonospora andamanensis]